MKNKCLICKTKKTKGPKYSDYCRKCGLYLGEINKEKVVETIKKMIERWNSPKKYDFYTKWSDGHIRFEYRGIKKIIDNVTFGEDLNFEEFCSLIQIISYLTIEFDYNITSLALTLFSFGSQFFENAKIPFNYWLKVGLKEQNRTAYDYLLGYMYSSREDETRRGKRKIAKIKEILRHVPNFQI